MNTNLGKSENNRPLVTVIVLCYNFESYVGECLESIVTQKTDFQFEILVADDCSQDRSPEIIESYHKNYPDLINYYASESNVGPKINMKRLLSDSRGAYIVHCDGDDIFHQGKLQKQIDFFHANPQCSIVYHKTDIINSKSRTIGTIQNKSKRTISDINDLVLHGNYIPQSSKMFTYSSMPQQGFKYYPCARALDYYRNIVSASRGKIGYINIRLGAYRKHAKGADSAPIDNHWRNFYGNLRALQAAKNGGVSENVLQQGYAKLYLMFSARYAQAGRFSSSKRLIKKSVNHKIVGIRQIAYYLLLLKPKIFIALKKIKLMNRLKGSKSH